MAINDSYEDKKISYMEITGRNRTEIVQVARTEIVQVARTEIVQVARTEIVQVAHPDRLPRGRKSTGSFTHRPEG
jgi:hypothetical protein